MVLPATSTNNVKVYTVSGSNLSRKIPEWLARRKRRELQKDIEWTTRIELIQDFGFPEASMRIKTTKDGEFCMATGVYKPQIRVYEFAHMSMKFDRHTDNENINFLLLGDDWTKSVHLPERQFGRDLAYHSPSCDVLVGGASSEVYRVNVDQGRFLNPFQTQSSSGINVVRVNPAHQLFGFGTQDGSVEFWDPRARNRIGVLEPTIANVIQPIDGTRSGVEISALEFRDDGLGAAVGTSSGHVLLYDLRQTRPWQIKDQQYGLPIKTLKWLEPILSADSKIIKLWSVESGKPFTSIEPPNDINDVCVVPNSGLMFVANEGMEIQSYFVPQLGPAPRWAHFLENLTEEMEETPQKTVYDDYKFVVRKELDALGLSHLVGTPVLKPYMHGFFVDLRLYERAKAIANPFAYEEYRLRRVQEKLAEARSSRIRATTKLPKVNRALAQRSKQRKRAKAKAASASAVLEDSRFTDMFANPDFEVDEDEEEFKQLHSRLPKKARKSQAAAVADDSSDDDKAVEIRQGAMSHSIDDENSDDDLHGTKKVEHQRPASNGAYRKDHGERAAQDEATDSPATIDPGSPQGWRLRVQEAPGEAESSRGNDQRVFWQLGRPQCVVSEWQ
ncbi:WD40 repeat-like protein [Linderina pennispora]|uniref:WD40 repeat-like protein n=1 Tax=Linderina pennispora TaxID=61395 RepID=A0A1Y1VXK9_9FUNG|nr:WD40 repeat-like protein [Linderina pennispora]ORX66020.1 WD40 repeat-like protein [Linderina pennispora]